MVAFVPNVQFGLLSGFNKITRLEVEPETRTGT